MPISSSVARLQRLSGASRQRAQVPVIRSQAGACAAPARSCCPVSVSAPGGFKKLSVSMQGRPAEERRGGAAGRAAAASRDPLPARAAERLPHQPAEARAVGLDWHWIRTGVWSSACASAVSSCRRFLADQVDVGRRGRTAGAALAARALAAGCRARRMRRPLWHARTFTQRVPEHKCDVQT